MIAILSLAGRITRDEFAVALMLLARLVPALFFGPIAGVLVDRFSRKPLMVFCDLSRAALIVVMPFVESIPKVIPFLRPVFVLVLVSALLEMLTLLWQPAKDSVLPNMVPRRQLLRANSLTLFAVYGMFPISGAAFGLLVAASRWLGGSVPIFSTFRFNEEHLAFFLDSITFLVSAVITSTLVIPAARRAAHRLDFHGIWQELVDGLRFIRDHPYIRPWVLGIGTIFGGVGIFLAIAVFYVRETLGAGAAGFGLLVTAVGIGLGLGFAVSTVVSRFVHRDVLFSAEVFGLGSALIGFASVSTLPPGLVLGSVTGFFAGLAYPSGLTLVQENVSDELRGRTLASMYSMVRLSLVASLALGPALAKVIGRVRFGVFGQHIILTGSRAALWLGGLVIIGAAVVTTRAIAARRQGLRVPSPGVFFVFEGGDGAGKTTQLERLARFLRTQGRDVVVTAEPGGTAAGMRIREALLDPDGPSISPKTEALLYAADRAQHVEEVIRPALERGAIVLSDRFLDSSLAYQGLARGLGIHEVLQVNQWAVGEVMPDLVFLLDTDPGVGLRRSGTTDRIEREGTDFHTRVRRAYRELARRYPSRFVIVDASEEPDEVEEEIRRRVVPFLEKERRRAAAAAPTGSPS